MNKSENLHYADQLHDLFAQVGKKFFGLLKNGEHARLSLSAEQTQFTRVSRGKVRQSGNVTDAVLKVQFISSVHSVCEIAVPFVPESGDLNSLAGELLARVRAQAEGVPQDPYVNLPLQKSSSETVFKGQILPAGEVVSSLLGGLQSGDDLVGLYAGGTTISGLADSAGTNHWFSSDTFFIDYSLWLENGRAVKSGYAGREWVQKDYLETVKKARGDLQILNRPVKVLRPAEYRVFLAPSATSELLNMFSWGALSEGSLQRNDSPLCAVRKGEKQFSKKFSLRENYGLGMSPRFTAEGELSPEAVPLIENGRFVQALCSARTAKEYGALSNGSSSESLRTPEIAGGELQAADALKSLGTGLYLSDLHYLNWSDMIHGRVTGMTRYGCVWVEDGQPVGPIQDMRFDETIFRAFGSELVALTRETEIIPETSTYVRRAFGGARVPGMLLERFNFTL
ncbi:MAG: TldD/PmbA family protein [Proteobacteria bacterium]|nr:TldD/PmbA family protein [Pseudomonadota bacterium]